jgi:hypothetical protein
MHSYCSTVYMVAVSRWRGAFNFSRFNKNADLKSESAKRAYEAEYNGHNYNSYLQICFNLHSYNRSFLLTITTNNQTLETFSNNKPKNTDIYPCNIITNVNELVSFTQRWGQCLHCRIFSTYRSCIKTRFRNNKKESPIV